MHVLLFHNSRNLAHREPGVKQRAANGLLLITHNSSGCVKDVKTVNPKHSTRSRYLSLQVTKGEINCLLSLKCCLAIGCSDSETTGLI